MQSDYRVRPTGQVANGCKYPHPHRGPRLNHRSRLELGNAPELHPAALGQSAGFWLCFLGLHF